MIGYNSIYRFHKSIIAILFLIALSLSGCGHKTTPIYIPNNTTQMDTK